MRTFGIATTSAYLEISSAIAAVLVVSSLLTPLVGASSSNNDILGDVIASVSGSEMLETIQHMENFGSRAFHLEGADMAAEYIYERFLDLGLDVSFQNFSFGSWTSMNVVAVKNGTQPGAGTLLFGAHYDSENSMATDLASSESLAAPGADDDASGVAAVIELAEALSTVETGQTIKFVAFGAEEMGFDDSGGLEGSTHFVHEEVSAGTVYECAIIIDMIGYRAGSENRAVIVTRTASSPFAAAAEGAVSDLNLGLSLETLSNQNIVYSDHAPFWSVGYPAILVTEELTASWHPVNPYYHSSGDISDHISASQMENLTRCLLAAAFSILGIHENGLAWEVVLGATITAACVVACIAFIIYSRNKRKSDWT